MAKVHPNVPTTESPKTAGEGAVLTVWRKSLLLNCSGFTVFNADGNLAFRVDNYSSATKDEIFLMDPAGKPLLTLRRKKLSLGDHWMVYDGEEAVNPRFSVKKHVGLRRSKALAHVTPCGGATAGSPAGYEVEGSYARRCCAVYGEGRRRRMVAEIQRKEAAGGVALSADVFRLVVEPGFDATVAMAIVVLLDQMFG